MWDDHYGPMHPGTVLSHLRPAVAEIDALGDDTPIPPELERLVAALRRLHRTTVKVMAAHDADQRYTVSN